MVGYAPLCGLALILLSPQFFLSSKVEAKSFLKKLYSSKLDFFMFRSREEEIVTIEEGDWKRETRTE
jgi:hypothetical protein